MRVKEVQEGTYPRGQALVTYVQGMDILPVARIEALEDFHETPGGQVRRHMEPPQPGDATSGRRHQAHHFTRTAQESPSDRALGDDPVDGEWPGVDRSTKAELQA